jgi:hypothetical protein
LPGRHRCGDALDLDRPEVAVLEEVADQPACARTYHDRFRLGQGLQAGGEVRRLADNRLFLRRAMADQIADDHQPGSDTDTRLKLDRFDIEATDGVDRAQPRSYRPLGVVLMGLRVAEIHQDAVAHIPGDKAAGPGDYFGDSAVIGGDHLAQILGIEPRRECGRADQVAEHHRQLPAFGLGLRRCIGGCRGRGYVRTERRDGVEQPAAVPDRPDAELA